MCAVILVYVMLQLRYSIVGARPALYQLIPLQSIVNYLEPFCIVICYRTDGILEKHIFQS